MRDERGQVATALVVCCVLGLVAVAVWGVALLARGADQKTQAQSAADAAALAGAGVLSDALPQLLALLADKDGLSGTAGCALGEDRARDYAARNDAELIDYCFDLGSGRVSVTVRMLEPVNDELDGAVADATASIGLDLADCDWQDDDPPEPEAEPVEPPSGGPTPDAEPAPPPTLGTTLSCGAFSAEFEIDGDGGGLSFVELDVDALEPALVE
ncbi:pilus assembly protein TadG-related protein [Nocardioides sp. C4-1]|uniref:pilus assembly protein TadG-related protein n=1 Tax=Nocardioides sp. C4-1 TaxID=3151851 RepID=UPI003264F7B2